MSIFGFGKKKEEQKQPCLLRRELYAGSNAGGRSRKEGVRDQNSWGAAVPSVMRWKRQL